MDPRFAARAPGRTGMGGNMMGPNHSMFQGNGVHGPPLGGPGSMQPLCDPFYPPEVNVDIDFGIDGKPWRNQPSCSRDPDPDHLPPPNAFGNDLLS
jgi:hypothetical protein